jgi:hypothetical protein
MFLMAAVLAQHDAYSGSSDQYTVCAIVQVRGASTNLEDPA